jgi:hypothetical protein
MKKFGTGDIIYNAIKTYPKVRFFANSGSVSYNNDTTNEGNAVLFDFLKIPQEIVLGDCFILQENSDLILTEDGNSLIIEDC